MAEKITTHRQLKVYKKAFDAALKIYEATKTFPREEIYSLSDQIRRSSRSVCMNLAEAWRKRRYEAAFIAKLSDSESEAAETQVSLEFAVHHGYINVEVARGLYREYEDIIGTIVGMINHPETWIIQKR